jgi:hypothetical protein
VLACGVKDGFSAAAHSSSPLVTSASSTGRVAVLSPACAAS